MYRIGLLIPTLDRGGAEKQLVLLATGLRERGLAPEVVVLTRSGPYHEDLLESGIPVHVVGKRGKIDPICFSRLSRLFKKQRYDLVQTWLFAANTYGRLAARHAGVRAIVATERCCDWWKSSLHFWIDRRLSRFTDRIVVNSQGVAAFYRDHVGLPADKIVVIPNAVAEPEHATFVNRRELRRELGLPEDSFVVGFVGRLWPQKRVPDLIWACDIVRNIRPQIRLLIVGDGPLRTELALYARDVGMGERTVFTGERADVWRLLQVMDAFVLPSAFEGMSNALMEAMLAGLPVVCTDIPGNRELVQHGITGLLVPPGNRAELARAIWRLMDAPELRHRLGEAARRFVRENFSVDRMVTSYVQLYRTLLDRQGPAEPVRVRETVPARAAARRQPATGAIRAALF